MLSVPHSQSVFEQSESCQQRAVHGTTHTGQILTQTHFFESPVCNREVFVNRNRSVNLRGIFVSVLENNRMLSQSTVVNSKCSERFAGSFPKIPDMGGSQLSWLFFWPGILCFRDKTCLLKHSFEPVVHSRGKWYNTNTVKRQKCIYTS